MSIPDELFNLFGEDDDEKKGEFRVLREDEYEEAFGKETAERMRYNRQVNKLKETAEQFEFAIDWEHPNTFFLLKAYREFVKREYPQTYQGIRDAIAWFETREQRFALNVLLGDIEIDL